MCIWFLLRKESVEPTWHIRLALCLDASLHASLRWAHESNEEALHCSDILRMSERAFVETQWEWSGLVMMKKHPHYINRFGSESVTCFWASLDETGKVGSL